MPIASGTISNLAFTLACITFVALGGLRLKESLSPQPPSDPGRPDPVTAMDAELSIEGAAAQGSENASLVLVEFSDFQCPFCAQHATQTYDLIKKEFVDTGKVRYVAMNLPLGSHPLAPKASEAAECAGLQGQFWKMRAQLFANPQSLAPPDLLNHATAIGLQTDSFTNCMNGETTGKVATQSERASKLGIRNTPAFLVGRQEGGGTLLVKKKLLGAHPIEVFRRFLGDAP